MATIALVTYLGNWAFVASIIVVKFMVIQCFFLLETLTQIDNNTFLVHQHLKMTCDILTPPADTCFLLFEQHIK
jgi:hypothetical protein